MRRSIATVSMSGTLRQKLEAIAAARFDGIELFENDFIALQRQRRASCARWPPTSASSIDLFQPFRDFEGMPDAQFQRSLDRAERKFDLMQALGAPLMLVCSNTSPLAARRPRARRGAAARARRARRPAQPAHRLRGARLGPPRQPLRPGLGRSSPRPTIRTSA